MPPTRTDRVGAISAALDLPGDVASVWAQLAPHKLAHRNALRLRVDDEDYVNTLSDVELVLETLSERWKHRYPEWIERLDEIAESPPRRKSVAAFLGGVPPIPTLWHHFFDRIEDPAWLKPLHDKQVFAVFPEPEVSDDGRIVRFAGWPAALFLEKVAPRRPDEVAAILRQVPASTNPALRDQAWVTAPDSSSRLSVPLNA